MIQCVCDGLSLQMLSLHLLLLWPPFVFQPAKFLVKYAAPPSSRDPVRND
jgi:hypothetical protein